MKEDKVEKFDSLIEQILDCSEKLAKDMIQIEKWVNDPTKPVHETVFDIKKLIEKNKR